MRISPSIAQVPYIIAYILQQPLSFKFLLFSHQAKEPRSYGDPHYPLYGVSLIIPR